MGAKLLTTAISVGLALIAPLSAAHADLLDKIRADGVLLVGVTDSSPPFSSRKAGETQSAGYDVDLASRVAAKLGVKVQQVTLRNQDRITFLQDGKAQLVAVGMSRTAERAKSIDFSYAYLDSPHKIIIRRDSGIASMNQLAGKTLALNKGASVDEELKAAVPTIQLVNYDNYDLCFQAVKEKRAASFLADEVLLLSMAQREANPEDFMLVPDYIGPRTSGFGLPKGEPRFKAFVNDALLELEASGEAEKIFAAWFPGAKRSFKIAPEKPGAL